MEGAAMTDDCEGWEGLRAFCVVTRSGIAQLGAFVLGVAAGLWWLRSADAKRPGRRA